MRRLAASLLAGLAVPAAAQGGHDWQVYGNARFAYAICYPADLLTPQPEADNGDGRAFRGADGALLRVYGLNNATGDSVAQAAEASAQSLGQVTYRVINGGGWVLSGRNGAEIFYEKSVLVDDQFKTFTFTYPAAAARLFDPVAAHIAGCFRPRS